MSNEKNEHQKKNSNLIQKALNCIQYIEWKNMKLKIQCFQDENFDYQFV